MKRKLESNEGEISRKRLKREIKKIIKTNTELKSKKMRRKLETNFSLPKKGLDPRKDEINKLLLKIRQKLEKKNVVEQKASILEQKEINVISAKPDKPVDSTAEKTATSPPTLKPKEKTATSPPTLKPDEKVAAWRKTNNVALEDKDDKAPFLDFDFILDEHKAPWKDFKKPTPIQAQSLPYALVGRDIVGIAETGSGKTLAFIWPAIKRHLENPSAKYGEPGALILAPTRELALQIQKQLETFGGPFGCKSTCVYGGVPKYQQLKELRNAKNIIVGTPGRLKAFVRSGELDLSHVDYVVLDEADRMLEQGFVPDVTELINSCKRIEERQTMLFSATWPAEVEKLGRTFMKNPVKITVQKSEKELSVVSTVSQEVRVMKKWDKEDALWELLTKLKGKKIIIFTLYKKECANLAWSVKDWGFNCVSLNGNMEQRERTIAMTAFRKNDSRLLVATDVASRGLDVTDVDYVINFSMPLTIEDYVHRVGRTGRAGKAGKSISFFTEFDKFLARDLVYLLEKNEEEVKPALLKLRCARRPKRRGYY